MVTRGKAPVEHLFNVHEWCDQSWCWAKQLDEKQQELTTRIMEQRIDMEQEYYSDSDDSDSIAPPPPPPIPTDDTAAIDDIHSDDGDSDWETCSSDESYENEEEDMEVNEVGFQCAPRQISLISQLRSTLNKFLT